jgi:hypothetical protein
MQDLGRRHNALPIKPRTLPDNLTIIRYIVQLSDVFYHVVNTVLWWFHPGFFWGIAKLWNRWHTRNKEFRDNFFIFFLISEIDRQSIDSYEVLSFFPIPYFMNCIIEYLIIEFLLEQWMIAKIHHLFWKVEILDAILGLLPKKLWNRLPIRFPNRDSNPRTSNLATDAPE